jgi:hypothetical protein
LRAKLYLHDKQTSERHNDSLQRFKKGKNNSNIMILAQKQRLVEHKNELKEMNQRINQRLSLFEQSEIANAREKVKKEFQKVLEKAGLKGIEF